MAGPERLLLRKSLRRVRWLRLGALRDLAALAVLAIGCGYGLGPAAIAAFQEAGAEGAAGAAGADAFKLLLCCAVLLALVPTFRRAWVRMTMLGRESRRLRSDLRAALVEESDHRTTRALMVGSETDGWLAAFLEDEDRNTLYVEAVPEGHPPGGLMERFPPAAVRFETGLHSGFGLMETREGPFEGPLNAFALDRRPRDLPRHGTVFEEPLDTVSRRILGGTAP